MHGETSTSCRDAQKTQEWLESEQLEIVGSAPTPTGMQGARILTVVARGADNVAFRVKWRSASSADLFNDPRKELAAHAVQKLFLPPGEYVVPPTAVRCFELQNYRNFVEDEKPVDGTQCVLGYVTLWLENVETVDGARRKSWLGDGDAVWSPSLFDRDLRYRTSLAQSNLFMYAINHGDPHAGQFILEKTIDGVRTYVVDNSIAFRSVKVPILLFYTDWSGLRVPAFPASTVWKIRHLRAEAFSALGVIATFRKTGASLKRTDVAGPPVQSGMEWDGSALRIGLTPAEIQLVRSRLEELSRRTDLNTFEPLPPASHSRPPG